MIKGSRKRINVFVPIVVFMLVVFMVVSSWIVIANVPLVNPGCVDSAFDYEIGTSNRLLRAGIESGNVCVAGSVHYKECCDGNIVQSAGTVNSDGSWPAWCSVGNPVNCGIGGQPACGSACPQTCETYIAGSLSPPSVKNIGPVPQNGNQYFNVWCDYGVLKNNCVFPQGPIEGSCKMEPEDILLYQINPNEYKLKFGTNMKYNCTLGPGPPQVKCAADNDCCQQVNNDLGIVVNTNVLGVVESSLCSKVSGWSCNPSSPSTTYTIEFYSNESFKVNPGKYYLGSITANQPGGPNVQNNCGGNENHKFEWGIPPAIINQLETGTIEKIYTYVKIGSNYFLLQGSPNSEGCDYCGNGVKSADEDCDLGCNENGECNDVKFIYGRGHIPNHCGENDYTLCDVGCNFPSDGRIDLYEGLTYPALCDKIDGVPGNPYEDKCQLCQNGGGVGDIIGYVDAYMSTVDGSCQSTGFKEVDTSIREQCQVGCIQTNNQQPYFAECCGDLNNDGTSQLCCPPNDACGPSMVCVNSRCVLGDVSGGITSAEPNPCIIPQGDSTCTVTISWTSTNAPNADLYVSKDGVNTLIGGSSGQISRQLSSGTHTFTLYEDGLGSNILDTVDVASNNQCIMSTARIAPLDCDQGNSPDCEEGESISLWSDIGGSDCIRANHLQIDAKSSDDSCILQFTGGDIDGIFDQNAVIEGNSRFTGTWQIPTIPPQCRGKTVNTFQASLWKGAPGDQPPNEIISSYSSGQDSFKFEDAINPSVLLSGRIPPGAWIDTHLDVLQTDPFNLRAELFNGLVGEPITWKFDCTSDGTFEIDYTGPYSPGYEETDGHCENLPLGDHKVLVQVEQTDPGGQNDILVMDELDITVVSTSTTTTTTSTTTSTLPLIRKCSPNGADCGDYCYQDSECYLPADYPPCKSDKEYKSDDYCENGEWTTRTKQLALQMLKIAGNGDYVLYCNNPGNVLIKDEDVPLNSNSFCVMKHDGLVIVGQNFNSEIQRDLFLNQLSVDCSNAADDGNYHACDTNKLWFNPSTEGVIFSKEDLVSLGGNPVIGFIKEIFQTIIQTILSAISGGQLNLPVQDQDSFVDDLTKFSRLYLSKANTKTISGAIEMKDFDNLVIEYKNFNTDICGLIDIYDDAHQPPSSSSPSGIECTKQNNIHYVVAQGSASNNDPKEIFDDLTSKLRVR